MKRFNRAGTLLTSEKPIEFSDSVLPESAGREGDEIEYIGDYAYASETVRQMVNAERENKFSYWRELSPHYWKHKRQTNLTDDIFSVMPRLWSKSLGDPNRRPLFNRKPASPLPGEFGGEFNYEDLSEEQAGKELNRYLQMKLTR